MADTNADTLNSLAAKLDGLDLTDEERALLDELLERAASYEPEVAGFSFGDYTGLMSGADLSPTGFRLATSLGKLPGGGGDDPPTEFRAPSPPIRG